MRLHWVVSCRSYELRDDETADIQAAGVDEFWVESLPTDLSLTLLARLGLVEGEEDELEIQLIGPGMQSLGTLIERFEGIPGPNHRPGHEIVRLQPLILRFEATTVGIHGASLYTNRRHEQSVFFGVRTGAPPNP